MKLKVEDIQFDSGTIKIFQHKTDKTKIIQPPASFIAEIADYIKVNNIKNYIFIGSKMNNEYYGKKFKALKIKLGLNQDYTRYTLRHTAATQYYDETKDPIRTAKLLGNNPETAILHYINTSPGIVAESLNNF